MHRSGSAKRTADNGVQVEALLATRNAMIDEPKTARFIWRVHNEWVNGTNSRSTVDTFYGLGTEQAHRNAVTLTTDHPEVLAAGDDGVTPAEMVLAGLVGCLTAGVAAVAQHRGMQLHAVTATVEGDMNLAGMLGIDESARTGFSEIRVTYRIDADGNLEDVQAIVAQAQRRSAVLDIVTNQTGVAVRIG